MCSGSTRTLPRTPLRADVGFVQTAPRSAVPESKARLTQMQAQRYGSLPIAHATGGLADTIHDGATGFLFSDLSGEGLFSACRRAFDVFSNEAALGEMRQAAMARSFHWSGAAAEYEMLYARLTGRSVVRTAVRTRRRRRRSHAAVAEWQAAA